MKLDVNRTRRESVESISKFARMATTIKTTQRYVLFRLDFLMGLTFQSARRHPPGRR